jgi:hypothetical protein
MMRKICLGFILIFIYCWTASDAQELRCNITIDATPLNTNQATEKALFDDLQKALNNFMNNQRWTQDEFGKGEQIECNLVITLTNSPAQNVFQATAQIQASRPVYNTNYESNLFSFVDRDFNFVYTQGQPLIFSPTTYTSNLTSVLAFYAYMVLALDYDTFEELGGSPYVEQAFNIMNIAQSSGEVGWGSTQNNRNRFWLIENLNSQQMLSLRNGLYQYHRLGLDTFLTDPEKARESILEAIKGLEEANKLKPSAVLINIFFDAKNREIVNIFKEAPADMRTEVHRIAVKLDPTNTEKYNVLTAPR